MNLAHKLQNDLINRIGQIDDVNFLKAIQAILDTSNQEIFALSEAQERSIAKSRQQIQNGEGIAHKDVVNDLRSWLKNG
ncbi:MAG: hypothetical protein R3B93_29445 [Bacteroidia bacterium]